MTLNVLLVNTSKKSAYKKYAPLALLKLSAKHKQAGDVVTFVEAGSCPFENQDIVYISTIFQFNFNYEMTCINAYAKKYPGARIIVGGVSVSTMLSKFEKHKKYENIEYEMGLVDDLDLYEPDYGIANIDYSYGFTSRGCVNKCSWCVVPVVEGQMRVVPSWRKIFKNGHNVFRGFDNNILANDIGHIEEVFSYADKMGFKIDFNQGMDCQRLMKSTEIQRIFLKYPKIWQDIRFAWDSNRVDKYALETLLFLKKNKINPKGDCIWYVLYDDKGTTPQDVFFRLKTLVLNKYSYSAKAKLMRFKDTSSGGLARNWGSLGDEVAHWQNLSITGIISKSKIDSWVLKDEYEDFIKRIDYLSGKNYEFIKKHRLDIPNKWKEEQGFAVIYDK
jgi:hypothetical protein